MKAPSKLDQLRAWREAKYAAALEKLRTAKKPPANVTRPIVTPELKANVTQLERRGGRAKVHGSPAERQKAYRARRKGNG